MDDASEEIDETRSPRCRGRGGDEREWTMPARREGGVLEALLSCVFGVYIRIEHSLVSASKDVVFGHRIGARGERENVWKT